MKALEMVKKYGKEFMKEEDGVGIVEIILILVILIGLVVIFKEQITGIVNSAMNSIKQGSDKIMK